MPHSYIITIDKDAEGKFKQLGFTPIITDATHFIRGLKTHLIDEGLMLDDERYYGIFEGGAAFRLDKSRQVLIQNCKVENMISISLGNDCSIIFSSVA